MAGRSDKLESSKVRLAEVIFESVVAGIRDGTYKPGQKITERQIAEELQTSHVPVREAMAKLQQLGWIDRQPQRGAYIKKLDTDEIKKVSQIREVFEAGAVRIATENITSEQLAELQQTVDLLEEACQNRNAQRYEELDCRFHQQLIGCVGNDKLDELFETVILQSHGFFLAGAVQAAFAWGENMEETRAGSHKRIYEALAAHDTEKAEELIRKHVKGGCELAVTIAKAKDMLND